MPVMLRRWNDDRMDGLEAKVDKGFERVDSELRDVRSEMSQMRSEMKAGFDRMQRLMVQFSGGLVIALIAALVVRA